MRLNIGCGLDYKPGWINIDGNAKLPRVDKVIDLSAESIKMHFESGSVERILANDFIEHHYHWEAVKLMRDFFDILKSGGNLEMKAPDFEAIVKGGHSIARKITLLFGGQDIPQGERDPSHRQAYPQFYCHKYAYTQESMRSELFRVGFSDIMTNSSGTNFIVKAMKP